MCGDVNFITRKASNRDGDAVAIIARLFNVVRRIIAIARGRTRIMFEHIKQTVKANHRTAVGGKIKSISHEYVLHKQHNYARSTIGTAHIRPNMASDIS